MKIELLEPDLNSAQFTLAKECKNGAYKKGAYTRYHFSLCVIFKKSGVCPSSIPEKDRSVR